MARRIAPRTVVAKTVANGGTSSNGSARRAATKRASERASTSANSAKREPTPPTAPARRRGRPPRVETEATTASYPGERVVRRYGNRRFYDLKASRAVTLEQLAQLAGRDERFRVIDVQGQDVTRRVLLHLLLEPSHNDRLAALPLALLRKLAAVRDPALLTWLEQYLAVGARFVENMVEANSPETKAWYEATYGPTHELPPGWHDEPTPPTPEGAVHDLQRQFQELMSKVKLA